MIKIPEMKNTHEALNYGKSIKGNVAAINVLKNERKNLIVKVQDLLNQGKDTEALYLASGQLQFTREALEIAIK